MELLINRKDPEAINFANQNKPLVAILRKIKTKLSLHQLPDISRQNTSRVLQEFYPLVSDSGLSYVPQFFMRPQRNTTMPYLKNGRISNHMLLLEKESNNKTLDGLKQESKILNIKQTVKSIDSKVQKKRTKFKAKILKKDQQNVSLKKIQMSSQHKLANQSMKPLQYKSLNLVPIKLNKKIAHKVPQIKQKPQLHALKLKNHAQNIKKPSQNTFRKSQSTARKPLQQKSQLQQNKMEYDCYISLAQITNKNYSQSKGKEKNSQLGDQRKRDNPIRTQKLCNNENKSHYIAKCLTLTSEKLKNQDLSSWEIYQEEDSLLEKLMLAGRK